MTASRRRGSALLFIAVTGVAIAAYRLRIQRDLVDFEVYRTAAGRAMRAEPLYRPEDGHFQFKYLPAFAVVMAPFAAADREISRTSWYAMSVGLLVMFVRHAVTALPDRRRSVAALAAVAVLVTAKFWIKELALGQTNLLLGVLLLGSYFAMLGRRPWLAGALVSIAVVVKPYAVLFVPWVVWSAGVAAIAPIAAGLVVALLAPAVFYGWQGNMDQLAGWYRTVTDTTAPNLVYPENISFATMWAKWIGPGPAASALALATIAASLLAAIWLVRRSAGSPPRYLELGFLALLVPLISPQGWDYVLLLGLPAYVCLVDRWSDLQPLWRAAIAAAIIATSFTVFDLLGRSLYSTLMSWSVVTIGAVGLLAGLIELRRRQLA